jgi:hypothetical protein
MPQDRDMRSRSLLLAALVAALLALVAVPAGVETVTAGRAYSAAL